MLKKSVIANIVLNIIIFMVNELIYINLEDKHTSIRIFSGITILYMFYYSYEWIKNEKNRFMLYPVFLIAAYIYHFGQFIVDFLGIDADLYAIFDHYKTFSLFRFRFDTLHFVQVYAWLCITSLHIGATIALRKFSLNEFILPVKSSTLHKSYPTLLSGFCLFLISFIPAITTLYNQYIIRTTYRYGEGLSQFTDTNIIGTIGAAFWPSVLFIAASFRDNRWIIIAISSIALLWFSVSTIIGDRGGAIQPVIATIWIFSIVFKKINWKIFLIFIFIFAFLVAPVISLTRTKNSINNFDVSTIAEILLGGENPVILFLAETGISAIPLADTVEVVPFNRPYSFGSGYIENLFISPMRWFIEPGYLGQYGPPSYWLVKTRYPERLNQNLFLGFSFIAETYLEFGFLGFIYTFFLGYILIWVPYIAIKNRSSILIAISAIFLSYLIHYSRGDSSELGRPFFRYIFLPVLLILFMDSLLKLKFSNNKYNILMPADMLLKVEKNQSSSSLTEELIVKNSNMTKSESNISNRVITERVKD